MFLNLGDSYSGGGAKGNSEGKKQKTNKGAKWEGNDNIATLKRGCGIPDKNLIGIPWRVAFALQSDGWILRQEIIWSKPNPMPESVTDRYTKSHESIFLLTKSPRYFFDHEAVLEPAKFDGRKDTMMKGSEKYQNGFVPNSSPQTLAKKGHERWPKKIEKIQELRPGEKAHSGYFNNDGSPRFAEVDGIPARNKRSVWEIATQPFSGAHFAVFPEKIPELCIKAGSREGDTILDPFFGAGTTGLVAKKAGRKYIGIELNSEFAALAEKRLAQKTIFE